MVNPVEQQQQQQSYTAPQNTRDQDYYVPMVNITRFDPDYYVPTANITRIMRRVLPPQAKIADDAKETVQECVTEFINMVTSEANDRCHREERKTITADDILWAIERLGFNNYVGLLNLFLKRYRETQREWSEDSREAIGRRVADFRWFCPPTYVSSSSSADAMGGMNLGHQMDDAGAGSSSSISQGGGAPSFGPFAQFKR